MRKLFLTVAFLLALVSSAAAADDHQLIQSFQQAVTAAEANFLLQDKVGANVRSSSCSSWLIENDSAAETVYIAYSVPGAISTTPTPTAVATDATPHQLRLKPGQAKELELFTNGYISIIGTGTASVRFELTCKGIGG